MAHITNKLRGLVAALVAVFAALALVPGTALAITNQDTTTLNFSGLNEGDTVKVYQIVATSYDEDSNSLAHAWGDGFSMPAPAYSNVDDFVDAYVENGADATGTGEFAQTVRAALNASSASPVETSQPAEADGNASVTITGYGLYFIVVENGDGDAMRVYENMIVPVQPTTDNGAYVEPDDINVTLKKSDITVNKQVGSGPVDEEDIEWVENSFGYVKGDTVPFKIETKVPTYPEGSEDRVFTISDTMGETLKFNQDSLKVYVNNVLVEDPSGVYALDGDTNATFAIVFDSGWILKNGGANVRVEYTAVLDGPAEDFDPSTNSATVEFSRDPVTGETYKPGDETHIVQFGYKILKYDGTKGDTVTLDGAEFAVYRDADQNGQPDDDTVVATTSTVNGTGTFTGLAAGHYVMIETKAPDGYQLDKTPIKFSIDAEGNYNESTFVGTVVNNENPHKVANYANPVLPVTGGAGTVALTAAGVVLIAGAAAFIVRSRKQN